MNLTKQLRESRSIRKIYSGIKRITLLPLFIHGIIRSLVYPPKYFIKRGYRHRNNNIHFSDIHNEDEYQREVYEQAENLARSRGYKKVIDVGCGSGFKLMKYFGNHFEIVGTEIKSTLEYLQTNYPDYTWLNGEEVDFNSLHADMVICSDVIEHVPNPDTLLKKIKSISGVKAIIISTPDRLLARGWYDYGPPANKTHIREWNGKEFYAYLQSQNLRVISHQISNYQQSTQLAICEIDHPSYTYK